MVYHSPQALNPILILSLVCLFKSLQLFFLLQIVRAHISIMHSAFIDLFAEGISIKYLLIALFGKLGLLLLDRIFWLKLVIYRFWSLHNSIYPTKLGLLVNHYQSICDSALYYKKNFEAADSISLL